MPAALVVLGGLAVVAPPDLAHAPAGAAGATAPELLPDLEQRLPGDVHVVEARGGRLRLTFSSAVENVGAGPLLIEGTRVPGRGAMSATQLVRRRDGSAERRPRVGTLRYVRSEDHSHWHLLRFDRYELRRAADFRLVRPDRKSGFCLGDRYRTSARVRNRPRGAPLNGDCGRGEPALRRLREGISVGYGDDYRAYLEGQYIDIGRLPPGRYVLIHRVNADRRLRESRLSNNAASVLLDVRWPRGFAATPRIRALARCPRSERCEAPRGSSRPPHGGVSWPAG